MDPIKHLVKQNPWECALFAFAMAFGTSAQALRKVLGHDGSKILDPRLPEPKCRQGFHLHEFSVVALLLGRSATPVQLLPVSKVGDTEFPVYDRVRQRIEYITQQLQVTRGVISSGTHAMAYENGVVYDPDGGLPFSLVINGGNTADETLLTLSARNFTLKEVWVVK